MKIEELLGFISDVPDFRDNKKVAHPLINIIFITFCAVLCRAESWCDVHDFGEAKKDWLSKHIDLSEGIPSELTFRRVFILLAPEHLEQLMITLASWLVNGKTEGQIAIDGKTLRGSMNKEHKAVHSVSAWSVDNGIVLAELATSEKSNEITAIPALLKLLKLSGCTVSIDAMGCQKNITEEIIDKKGHYLIGLKENQPKLHQKIETILQEKAINAEHCLRDYFDNGHGRETRRRYFSYDISGIEEAEKWVGLKTAVAVETITTRSNRPVQAEWRYYITSHKHTHQQLPDYIRHHWGIENKLHWVLDVNLGEDSDKKIERNSAKAFAVLKRIALNVVRSRNDDNKIKGKKRSLRGKLKRAGWDNNYLLSLLT